MPGPNEMTTPAEHAREAARHLDKGSLSEAVVQALLANTGVLTAILDRLEVPAAPTVPGLPPGYVLGARQSPTGHRFWTYVVTAPDGSEITNRHLWPTELHTLVPGVQAAQEHRNASNGGSHHD